MFEIYVLAVFLGLVVLLALVIYGLGSAIKWQANKTENRFFAPIPTPATFVLRVLEGRLIDVIENVKEWALDSEGRFILDKSGKDFGFLGQHLGVIWIGVFETIKIFKDWSWPEFRQVKSVGEDGKESVSYEVRARTKDVREFRFQIPYSVRVENIELSGNIQASLNAVFTVFFLYPARAIFLNKDPVELFVAMVRSAIRAWMSEKDFDTIKQITVSSNKSADQIPEFWEMLENLNGITFDDVSGNPDYEHANMRGIYGKLGIAIVRVELEQVEAAGDTFKALEAKRLAELNGDAQIKAAEKAGEARVTAARKDAEALGIRQQAQANFVMATIVDPIKEGGDSVGHVLEAQVLTGSDSKLTVLVQRGAGAGVTIPAGKQ